MYTNKICVKINCYKGFGYEDTLNGIKNAGLKYVELSSSKGNSLGLSQDMTNEELLNMKNDMLSRGLIPLSIGGNSYIMDDDTSKILKNINIAKVMGCKNIVETVFNPRNDADSFASDEEIADKIKFYIPYLEENDLDLVIELHGNYSTGKTISNILKPVNNKHVHINYDTGNALFWGKLSVEEMVQDYKDSIDNISYMHVKDKLGPIDVWNFPAVGSGYIPFKEIFEELHKKNNNATLSIEVEFTDKGVSEVGEVDKALLDSANYLKSLGFTL